MTRRRATIMSHWAAFLLLILLVAGGPLPVLAWGYVAASALMCALAVVFGLLNGPGPQPTTTASISSRVRPPARADSTWW